MDLCPIPGAAFKTFYVRRVRDLKPPRVPLYFYFSTGFADTVLILFAPMRGSALSRGQIHVTSRGVYPPGVGDRPLWSSRSSSNSPFGVIPPRTSRGTYPPGVGSRPSWGSRPSSNTPGRYHTPPGLSSPPLGRSWP